MCRRIIDLWAARKIQKGFVWGDNDCHWLIYDFLTIQAQWQAPKHISELRGTYNTPLGAAKTIIKMNENVVDIIKSAGYEFVDDKEAKVGDIVKFTQYDAYDTYLPVIYNGVVLVGDHDNETIVMRNMKDISIDYEILRRKKCLVQ